MKFRMSFLFATFVVMFVSSCSTPKEIAYFQDLRPGETSLSITSPVEIRLRAKDEISIIVNSKDRELSNLFNLPIIARQVGNSTSQYENTAQGVSGYVVDNDGCIDFPVIGKIKVMGMTRQEVAQTVKSQLMEKELVKDPVVTVKFTNLSLAVLGEVARPGRYVIDRDKVTILDAIAMAGDLTIYGKRKNVTVQREENGTQHVYTVNLCKAGDLYSSPVYYLQQNDVIYVAPNDTRANQSTVNGNNVRSTSFWLSLASLLTSVAVLIFK